MRFEKPWSSPSITYLFSIHLTLNKIEEFLFY
jgi:hypothetical protein